MITLMMIGNLILPFAEHLKKAQCYSAFLSIILLYNNIICIPLKMLFYLLMHSIIMQCQIIS
jgi:hypothetical protein